MKAKIVDIEGKEKGSMELPPQFSEELRDDVIRKVKFACESNRRQPYGAKSVAGMQHHADLSRRRRDYRGSYGHGISRVPRKILSKSGTRFNWVGAVAPGTVGGRRAHPPKASKNWKKKINKKERVLALRSAMSYNVDVSSLKNTHLQIPQHYPFILSKEFESLNKTKDVIQALEKIGVQKELMRGANRSIRAGRGKSRGRKYRSSRGILFIVGERSPLQKSASGIAGIDVCRVDKLNVPLLCPGPNPGRITLYTENAIQRLKDEALYLA